uniref:Receptor expression-enhancing protein n=1 Tax=Panagrolaimus superbus TaxID=310955 RepID=A0A914YTD6_9BILA
MIFVLGSRIIMLTAGVLYPAYRSFKAVRNKDVKEYVKWMMYWIVFALITCVEAIADVIISFWFPFYYEIKIILIIWLISPWTKGASTIYRNFVHPWLLRHENDIDFYLEQAKTEGYNQAMQIGTKSLLYARDMVATAAMRGQEQITQQLQRSLSMNDINNRRESAATNPNNKKPRRRTIERQEDWIEELPEDRHDDEDIGDTQSYAGPYNTSTRHESTLINDDSPKSSRSSSRTPSGPRSRSTSTSRTLSGDNSDTPSKNLRSRKTLG